MASKTDKKPRMIDAEELKQHNTQDDCWLVIDGQVYDVTAFLDQHPGGPEIVAEHAGTDGTDAFEDIGHSVSARKQLKEYLVGSLHGAPASGKAAPRAGSASATASDAAVARSGQASSSALTLVLAILAVVAAAVAYQMFVQ